MRDVEIRNVKGTFDYLPKEQKVRDYVTNVLKGVFESYGYMPAVTPMIYYYDVLASKYSGGAEILKEVYKVSDQGGRELALRYDLTTPFAKLICLTKDITMPFKRYEIGKVFRDGPVKVGRNREFIQCDVDVVGVKDVFIDAELISLYVAAFDALEIPCIVEYNNRKVMTGILEICGVSEEKMAEVITVIDKFKKLTKEEIVDEFLNTGLKEEQIEKIYQYFSIGFEGLFEMLKDSQNQNLIEGLKELKEVSEYVDFLGIKEKTKLDLTLARGLAIYTGTVFEVFAPSSGLTSAIGGGGRYDKIITNFIDDGNEYPATGCSFGLDIICEIVKNRDDFNDKNNIDLLIIPLNTKKESLKLANSLRKNGIKVEINYNDRKLNKLMNSADRDKIPFVIILGEDEVTKNQIQIKDMLRNETITTSLDDINAMVGLMKEE